MMLTLRDLELMRHIGMEKSLIAAGRRAGMAAPSATNRLNRIEEIVGESLVIRSGRRFELTPAGKIVAASATLIADELRRMNELLQGRQRHGRQTLRLACSDTVLMGELPAVLGEFLGAHPTIDVAVVSGDFDAVAALVASGEADLALFPHPPAGHGLRSIPYRLERICLIVPDGHELARRPGAIALADALPYDFVSTHHDLRLTKYIADHAPESLLVRSRVTVDTLAAQAEIIARSRLGIGLTVESIARQAARTYPVKMIPLADKWARLDFHLLAKNLDNLGEVASLFAQHIKSRVA